MNKILLFEKNTFFREFLPRLLENRFPEIDIKVVCSNEECLAEMRNFKPDILFLNVNQRDGKGYFLKLLSHIRLMDATVNILILTEYDFPEYRKVAILEGANHFIPKDSWTSNEILALTKNILGASISSVQENNGLEYNGKTITNEFLERPLERRKQNMWGQSIEMKYLKHHPDRRNTEFVN